MRRDETQTYWSKGGTLLSVPQLAARLIEILKMFKGKSVPDELETTMPRQKQQSCWNANRKGKTAEYRKY